MPRCPITGKIAHADRSRADTHLVMLVYRCNYRGRVYRCRFCGLFHVGTVRNYKKARSR